MKKNNKEKRKDISLIEYFNQNKEKYEGLSVELVLEKLLADFLKDFPVVLRTERSTLICVDSVEEVLNEIDFNWVDNLNSYAELVWFEDGEPIGDLKRFYRINMKYFDSIVGKKIEQVSSVLKAWNFYIGELIKNTGTFHNKLFDSIYNILCIKNENVAEWTEDQNSFVTKVFGDQDSFVFLNFIYKEGDSDFEPDALQDKIKKAKFLSLF